MKKKFIAKPHWASEFVNVQCGRCGKNPAEIIIPPENSLVCVDCAEKQGIVLPPPQPVTITTALKILNKRDIKTSRFSVLRWCKDGLLPAAWDELANRWRPYRDGVENFIPPKKGNPKIHLLRNKTLRKKK